MDHEGDPPGDRHGTGKEQAEGETTPWHGVMTRRFGQGFQERPRRFDTRHHACRSASVSRSHQVPIPKSRAINIVTSWQNFL
jgi:hypothetical protein